MKALLSKLARGKDKAPVSINESAFDLSNQFLTLEQAQAVARWLTNIGGGVLPYKPEAVYEDHPPEVEDIDRSSGIYIPRYYTGPFATPSQGAKSFFHFRFANGADGFNAGLMLETMRYAPTRWPAMIATEVNAAKKR